MRCSRLSRPARLSTSCGPRPPPEAWDGTTVCEPEDNPDIGPITLLQLAILRLTEVEVHGTDLDLGLSDWSDPFIDAALPMRIAWLPRRHTPSQAPSGSWNLVATDGPSFNVAVSQGVVSASHGKACQSEYYYHKDNAGLVVAYSLNRGVEYVTEHPTGFEL